MAATPSRRNFHLNIEGDIFFKRGAVNLIVGPTGSGKTSLLLALLGELHFSPRGPDAWFNLPKEGGIAYAAQEPWVQNETIKVLCGCVASGASLTTSTQSNIIFGADFDAERYKKGGGLILRLAPVSDFILHLSGVSVCAGTGYETIQRMLLCCFTSVTMT